MNIAHPSRSWLKQEILGELSLDYSFVIIHCFSRHKWLYRFIILCSQVIFRHFFSVGIGNELLHVTGFSMGDLRQQWQVHLTCHSSKLWVAKKFSGCSGWVPASCSCGISRVHGRNRMNGNRDDDKGIVVPLLMTCRYQSFVFSYLFSSALVCHNHLQ